MDIVSRPEIDIVKVAKGEDFIYSASVALRPPVTLGEYKGVEVERADAAVQDEDIEAEIKKEQERNSRLVVVEDRPAENGDNTIIDFDGAVDGFHFEGGKGEDYPLVLGSNSFIKGFEEQIIGHSAGESFDVHVVFPEEYHAKDLAGKPAVFAVTLKEIKKKELPEIDDAFAGEVSEFETLAEYKEDIRKKLTESKEKQAVNENENSVIAKVVEGAQIDVPEPMVKSQVDQMVNDYARRMQSQGLPLDQYMKFTGMTIDSLREQMTPQAMRNIRTRLTLEEIAKAESLSATEEEIERELSRMAESYKMELDKIKEIFGEEEKKQLSQDIAVQKAIDFIVAEAKLV